MSILSEISIGWDYAWWFPAIYALITLLVVAIYGRDFGKKFFRFPTTKSRREKLPVALGATVFGRLLMFIPIFVPLSLNTPWFWIGSFVFGIGMILTTIAMVNFASTPLDQPVVTGLYKISRNPIQLIAIFMWLGVALATESWIIAATSALLAAISYPTFLAQERSCLELYGYRYQEYMESTPRFILF